MDAKPTMTPAEEAAWREQLEGNELFPVAVLPGCEAHAEREWTCAECRRNREREYRARVRQRDGDERPFHIRPSRSYHVVEPQRTRCRLCGLVWLAKGDVCGPNLRSMKEQAQIDAKIMARRAS